MEARPKIKVTLSSLDKTLESAGVVCLLFVWMLTIYALFKLPHTIPSHFNASGEADGTGSRNTLLLLPVIGTIVYLALTQLNKYPWVFNYMTKITTGNALQQYSVATRMIRFLKLSLLVIFTIITLFIYLTAMGIAKGIGAWFMPSALILIIAPSIFLIIKSVKAKP